MAKWSFLPWRQSSASKYRPDTLNFGCISTSKSGEFSVGDANNKAVPVMPVGCVIPFAGAAAPTGWLLCQGQAVSRTTYAQLFSVIGTTYGSGDGSTTFNLPDMRGRVAVGSDANSPGAQCGETAHKLGISEIPSHSHPYSAYLYSTGAENGRINSQEGAGVKWADPTNTRNSGGGDNHNNMQPSLYLHHIIKIYLRPLEYFSSLRTT